MTPTRALACICTCVNGILSVHTRVHTRVSHVSGILYARTCAHAWIGSDNPNKGLGILKGCHDNAFFTRGSWNADFVAGMHACVCMYMHTCTHAHTHTRTHAHTLVHTHGTHTHKRTNTHTGMEPQEGDIVIKGKRGLDAFPGTDLEAQLLKNGIKTVVCVCVCVCVLCLCVFVCVCICVCLSVCVLCVCI